MSKQPNNIMPINVRSYLEEKCSDLIAQYEYRDERPDELWYYQKSQANIDLIVTLPPVVPTMQSSTLTFNMHDIHSIELWALGAHNFNELNKYMLQRDYHCSEFEGHDGMMIYEICTREIDDIKGVFTLANDVVKYLNKE